MAWTAFSSIGILLQTKPQKKETREIHGVDQIMEKSKQSPLAMREFQVTLVVHFILKLNGLVFPFLIYFPIFKFAGDQHMGIKNLLNPSQRHSHVAGLRG